MNKKILIGVIIAIAVLIGVSFTSVVGYRSGTPDVKASPLFKIRSSRAIDTESEDLSCEYVGKGAEITIRLPNRDIKREQIEKIIDIIKNMDDKTFRLFIQMVLKEMNQKNILPKEITQVQSLYNIKNYPGELKLYLNTRERDESDPPTRLTNADECCYTFGDELICKLFFFIVFLIMFLMELPAIIIEYIFAFFCYIIPPAPTFV